VEVVIVKAGGTVFSKDCLKRPKNGCGLCRNVTVSYEKHAELVTRISTSRDGC
jgi:hypothetical protein